MLLFEELPCQRLRNIRARSNIGIEMLYSCLQLRCDLQCRASGPNDSHVLVRVVIRRVPIRGVKKLALECLDAGNVRPFPCIEEATSIDEDFGTVLYLLAFMLDLEVPFSSLLIPDGRGEFVVESDELAGAELVCTSSKVVQDFRPLRVVL